MTAPTFLRQYMQQGFSAMYTALRNINLRYFKKIGVFVMTCTDQQYLSRFFV